MPHKNVKYAADHREQAKAENKRLMTLDLTGVGGKGGITIQGPVSEAEATELTKVMRRFIEGRSA